MEVSQHFLFQVNAVLDFAILFFGGLFIWILLPNESQGQLKYYFLTESPTSLNALPDDQLLEAFRNSGNNVYLGVLLERYTLLLFGVCMKYLKNEDDAKETSSKKAESQQNDLEVSTNNNNLERIEFGKYVFILGEDAETDKELRSLIWYLKHEGTHF